MDLVELAETKINAMIDNSVDNYIEKLENDNERLQARIDKAIEYMQHFINVEFDEYSTTYAVKCEFKEVLKALKGEE